MKTTFAFLNPTNQANPDATAKDKAEKKYLGLVKKQDQLLRGTTSIFVTSLCVIIIITQVTWNNVQAKVLYVSENFYIYNFGLLIIQNQTM